MENKFLTPNEAAVFLGGLNSRTVTRWAREGYLPAYPIGEGKRRLWRFLVDDLEQWMLARRTGQGSVSHRCSVWRIYPMNGVSKPQNRFQHGSLTLVKNRTVPDTWYFRFYEERNGKRVYRKRRIGTVQNLPRRRDAEKAVNGLGASLSQQQFDGLVSFAFNVRNYGSSTLFGNVSSGTAVTEANFTAYGHAHVGGKLVEVPSLMARRRSEYNIYANGVYDSSH